MALFVFVYSRVRVASERGKRENPAECPATNARQGIAHGMECTKLNYDSRFAKRSLRTAFAQEYYINYNYKYNSQEYIQSIIK